MALHNFALDVGTARFRNEERRRIEDWLKSNTPRFEAKMNDGKCEMFINGVIGDDFGGVSSARFEQELNALGDGAKEITLFINSPGGFVDDGMAIYNALVRHPARVVTNVTGQAASAASFVVQAGDERCMGESTTMFLHRAIGLTYGNDVDHEKMVAYLRQTTEGIANVYAKRSGRRVDSFIQMMTDETQLTAQQALDAKLIDTIMPLKKPGDVQNMAGAANEATSTPVSAKSIINRKLRLMALENV